MTSGSVSARSHTSARMMKDTTGTAFTTATSGLSSSRRTRHRAAAAASTTPNAQESRKPPKMWHAEEATVRQKEAVTASSASRVRAATGEASSRWPWG